MKLRKSCIELLRCGYLIGIFWICSAFLWANEPIQIWEKTPEKAHVELIPYLINTGKENIAVIVCPGGSYCWLDEEAEGRMVAEWLNDIGMSAFVLKYRTAGIGAFITHSRLLFRGNQYPDAMQDIQQSISLVRKRAKQYSIDPCKVGVMGFSAGGHLALSAGTYYQTDYLALLGIDAGVSLRPDFIAAIYPVVTFSDKRYVHKRSRRGLLGEKRKSDRTMQDSLSIERKMHPGCPPVFLVNCMDDPVVVYNNSILLDSVLTANRVPHKYILYKTGGHGFGADPNKGSRETRQWKVEFQNWLMTLF